MVMTIAILLTYFFSFVYLAKLFMAKERLMSRYFTLITVNELKKKIESYRQKDQYTGYYNLTPIVEKDLQKVKFDCENITDESDTFGAVPLLGYQTLSNSMTYLGVCAGGDWQS